MAARAEAERKGAIEVLKTEVKSFSNLIESIKIDAQFTSIQKVETRLRRGLIKLTKCYDVFVNKHNAYRNTVQLDNTEIATDDKIFKKWYDIYDCQTARTGPHPYHISPSAHHGRGLKGPQCCQK